MVFVLARPTSLPRQRRPTFLPYVSSWATGWTFVLDLSERRPALTSLCIRGVVTLSYEKVRGSFWPFSFLRRPAGGEGRKKNCWPRWLVWRGGGVEGWGSGCRRPAGKQAGIVSVSAGGSLW